MVIAGLARRVSCFLATLALVIGALLIVPRSEAADIFCVVTFDAFEPESMEEGAKYFAEHLEQMVAITLTAMDGKAEKRIEPASEEAQVTKDPLHISAYYKGLMPGAYRMRIVDLGAGSTAVYLEQIIQVRKQAEPQVFKAYLPGRISWFRPKFDAGVVSDLEPQDNHLRIHFQRVPDSKDDAFKNDFSFPLLHLKPDKEERRGLAMAHDGAYRVTLEGVPESWGVEQKVHLVKGKFVPEVITFVKGKTWNGPVHRRVASQE